jgi:hypothetical protein
LLVTLRAHALSHPLLLFAVFSAIFAVINEARERFGPTRPGLSAPAARAGISRAGLTSTYLLVLLYLATVIVYAATPAYFDHVEPSVASVSWLVVRGQPAYPDPESAGMYGLPYGPLLFLLNGLTMKVLGAAIITSKIAGAGAAVASLLLVGLAVRRAGGHWPLAMRWTALIYLMFGAASTWVRAEPLLLLSSSLAVLSLTVSRVPSLLLLGLAIGAGVNLKVSALVYLLPAFVLVWKKHGAGASAAAAGAAGLVAAVPYLTFSNISVAGYLAWLQAAAGQGIRLGALPTALEWMIVLMLPMMVMGRAEGARGGSDAGRLRALVIAAIAVSIPLAIKHGTGVYHFLPFVPSIMFAACAARQPGRMTLAPAMLATFVLIATLQVTPWVTATTSLPARQIVSELRQITAAHTGVVAMGYSANYRLSFFRPELVFHGQPYTLDAASMMDWHWSGRLFPHAALDALRDCAVDAWVIPAGGPPFVLQNAYPIAGGVFPESFRTTFEEHYRLETSGQWFDVWRCRRSGALDGGKLVNPK